MLKIHKFEYSVQKFSLACRKNATKVQNETELMLLKGDVLRTGIKCRANQQRTTGIAFRIMDYVYADCQSAEYKEKSNELHKKLSFLTKNARKICVYQKKAVILHAFSGKKHVN